MTVFGLNKRERLSILSFTQRESGHGGRLRCPKYPRHFHSDRPDRNQRPRDLRPGDPTTCDPETCDPEEARVQEARSQEARVQEAKIQEAGIHEESLRGEPTLVFATAQTPSTQ